jgi:hypothetical protein
MSESVDLSEVEKEKEIDLTEKDSDSDSLYDDYYIAKKLVQLKQSADSRRIEFALKFKTVKKLLSAKTCYYTGKVFTKKGPGARSIDRVDATKGYTDNNVVACTTEINAKKTNLTVDEILVISKRVQLHQRKTDKPKAKVKK